MTSSCATRSTFTVFDVLITTGLSAVAVEAALRAGAVTMAGRLVTDPYAPVHRRDRVWLHNKLVRSGVVLGWRTLRLPGYERGIYLMRWSYVLGNPVPLTSVVARGVGCDTLGCGA